MPSSHAPAEASPSYVVELTPPGRGAVAVVLAAGPLAVRAVGQCFVPNSARPLTEVPIERIVVGHWGGPEGEELVVCRRSDDEVEVHAHGGIAAVREVMDSLVAKGCQELEWREWLRRRSVISPKLEIDSRRDGTTLDAQIALADAVTLRTAAILVDQLNGALSRAIHDILSAVTADDWPRAAALADELWARRELGLHLTSPWRVVFAGPPNVGKSSLMNALAGYERAIVSPEPGTTRDVVTLATAIDGWPVQLADTAGLRRTTDELESAGVALAERALAAADLAVLVADATQPTPDARLMINPLPPRVVRVLNKIDLSPGAEFSIREGYDGPAICTSAITGSGIAELASAIGQALVPLSPPAGAAVPFTARQVAALAEARAALARQHTAPVIAALQAMLAVTSS